MVVGGFPSPADDYIEAGLDLNSLLIPHPISTFLWRVSGEAMQGAGIFDGDLLRVVVAEFEGAFTLKRLERFRGGLRLQAAHPAYPPIDLTSAMELQIWGVATHVIHPL